MRARSLRGGHERSFVGLALGERALQGSVQVGVAPVGGVRGQRQRPTPRGRAAFGERLPLALEPAGLEDTGARPA
jgi:hypothetical protein